jgi:hypothetical protein
MGGELSPLDAPQWTKTLRIGEASPRASWPALSGRANDPPVQEAAEYRVRFRARRQFGLIWRLIVNIINDVKTSQPMAAPQCPFAMTASDVVWELSFVGQGNDPSGMTFTAAPLARNFSTAANGPEITTPSDQRGRPPGK